MALIKCSECGKEISDRATMCPNCGYSKNYNKTTISERAETSPDVQKVYIKQCPVCERLCFQVGIYYCPTCNVRLVNKEENTKSEYLREQKSENKTKNIPKCPTCQSANLKKVSTMSKAGSVFMWGLLSQKVKKQWHCNNCGYEW